MATDLRTLPGYLADDATFRAWGGGISAQLVAIGLVRTTDTGQIDWTTVVRPATTSTYAGYEVWRFNDGLQATRPIFIKVEYGTGPGTTPDRPAFRITIGSATNGAGTLTGQVTTAMVATATVSRATGATAASYCSGGTGRLVLVTDWDAATPTLPKVIVVERPRTAAGADVGDATLCFVSGSGATTFVVLPYTGAVPATNTVNPAIDPAGNGHVPSLGTDVALMPTLAGAAGRLAVGSLLLYRTADMAALGPITLDFLGATRTYMPLGGGLARSTFAMASAGGSALAMPWE